MKEAINTHLPNLIDCTKFNIELLTGLISTNLITASERDEISTIQDRRGSTHASEFFFRTVFPRIGSDSSTNKTLLEVLLKSGQSNTVQILQDLKICETVPPKIDNKFLAYFKSIYGLKDRDRFFTGREKELELLSQWHGQTFRGKPPFLITGLGGIGKSSIVRKFLETFESDPTGSIIWLNGEVDQFEVSVLNAMQPFLNSKHQVENPMITFQKLLESNTTEINTFIVVDNLESIDDDSLFLFKPLDKVAVIVTSRYKQVLPHSLKTSFYNVTVLDENDSLLLTRRILEDFNIQTADQILQELCRALDYFPLSLTEAVYYIISKRNVAYSVQKFLRDINCSGYKTHRVDVFCSSEHISIDSIHLNTYSTWDGTIRKILNHQFARVEKLSPMFLLKLLSFGRNEHLAEQNFIQITGINLLAKQGIGKWECVDTGSCLNNLTEKCTLTRKEIENSFWLLSAYSMIDCSHGQMDLLYRVNKMLQLITRLKFHDKWKPAQEFLDLNQDVQRELDWTFPDGKCNLCAGDICHNITSLSSKC